MKNILSYRTSSINLKSKMILTSEKPFHKKYNEKYNNCIFKRKQIINILINSYITKKSFANQLEIKSHIESNTKEYNTININKYTNIFQLSEILNIDKLDVLKDYNNILGTNLKDLFTYLNPDDLELYIMEKGYDFINVIKDASYYINKKRPIVVTIMGHVDHGKTTLLDNLRNLEYKIVDTEFGKITQTIGAFNINIDEKTKATIIDTPGHEAFAKMRLRGAKVTDCIILVISAVEGIKKQTHEVLELIKSNKIPFIIAFNKFDLEFADIEQTQEELFNAYNIIFESDEKKINEVKKRKKIDNYIIVPTVNISAKYGTNIDLLKKEILKLNNQINPEEEINIPCQAYVIESKVGDEKYTNLNISLLIKKGILKVGDYFVCSNTCGKIKSLKDDKGNNINEAFPGQAVEITGIKQSISSGNVLCVVKDYSLAEKIVEEKNKIDEYFALMKKENIGKGIKLGKIKGYKERKRIMNSNDKTKWEEKISEVINKNEGKNKIELDEVNLREVYLHQDQKKNRFMLKADTEGVIEALMDDLKENFSDEIIERYIISFGIGQVTEDDIEYAKESKSTIFCFNSNNDDLLGLCSLLKIGCRSHKLIFELSDEIKHFIYESIMLNEVNCDFVPYIKGKGEIKSIFQGKHDGKLVNIAGVEVFEGQLHETNFYRISSKLKVKGKELKIVSLKQNKVPINVVKEGELCGIIFENFYDFEVGDSIYCYTLDEKRKGISDCSSYVRCFH